MSLSPAFTMPDTPMDRGKLLDADAIKAQGDKFSRYLDIDGDGIPQRTIPGNPHPKAAYFARGSGHNEHAVYSERADDYQYLLDRLRRKYETARRFVPKPIVENGSADGVGIISFGSRVEPVREARHMLSKQGNTTDHLLLRALPLTSEVEEFLSSHKRVFLVEQNRDGQMTQILRDDYPQYANRITPICHYDGMPLAAGDVAEKLMGEL
jgi:2-oxoglutarate ferredoxin oxidoreductase subunit alpha